MCQFDYKLENDPNKKIHIKSFENNFCPTHFNHPSTDILINISSCGFDYKEIEENSIWIAE